MAAVQRFDPALSRAALAAGALFIVVLAGLGAFLWNVHRLTLGEQLLGSAALVAALWAIGALTQPRAAAEQGSTPMALGR